jgi:hypothetical protein
MPGNELQCNALLQPLQYDPTELHCLTLHCCRCSLLRPHLRLRSTFSARYAALCSPVPCVVEHIPDHCTTNSCVRRRWTGSAVTPLPAPTAHQTVRSTESLYPVSLFFHIQSYIILFFFFTVSDDFPDPQPMINYTPRLTTLQSLLTSSTACGASVTTRNLAASTGTCVKGGARSGQDPHRQRQPDRAREGEGER